MNKKAFSLIELIVWITISMILMVSVGLFISNWMQSIFKQQLVLENTDHVTDFAWDINTSFNLIQTWSFIPVITWSGILFKRWINFSEWWFSYIWTELLDQVYCDSDSEDSFTNSVFIKSFIPFEENWEDIFWATPFDDLLSFSDWWYTSYQKDHSIKDSSNNIVVWKWIFWNDFSDWSLWTDVYLNSPTWLALSWTGLYISDTLNNRIIVYDTNSNLVKIILDESDWLDEPTGLHYEASESALYISNSWKWEILKYSSKQNAKPINQTFSFSWVNASWVDNFALNFYNTNGSVNITAFGISNNNFNNDVSDYSEISWNEIDYYFSDFSVVEDVDWPKAMICGAGVTYTIESWVVMESTTTCAWPVTGTIIKRSWALDTDLINTQTYEITLDSITWDFTTDWTYYVNLKLFDWLTELYSEFFPYFTEWDDDLNTLDNNTLEIVYSWLYYPTWIWWTGNTDFIEFWTGRTYSNLSYDKSDSLLWTPVESLDVSIDTVNSSDMLNLILKYYKSYNCYNLDDKNSRTYIAKKSLK